MELFVPWQYVGNGAPVDEPAVGKMLGLALGYDDRDVTANVSGHLRWPNKADVWGVAGQKGPNPASAWADLLIGPMLGK